MAIVNIEFIEHRDFARNITIDGKFIKVKKNKEGKYIHTFETTKEKCEVVIFKGHQYYGKNWVLWNLLFFIISVFGIFDGGLNKRCLVADCRLVISCERDTNVIIKGQSFVDGEKLVQVETEAEVVEVANKQYCDKDAQKKHSKMKKIKLLTVFVCVILTVVLIVLL